MWPFTRKRQSPPGLLQITRDNWISKHQLFEGCLGIGGTGSGKTSTLLHLMLALMREGAGMLFLTAKADDYETIARLAKRCGRECDLIRFHPDEPWRFDFLDYEIHTPGGVASASQLMQDLVDFSTRSSTASSHEPFWPIAAARKIRMAMIAIVNAIGRCSVSDVYEFCTSMANSPEQLESKAFQESACCQCLELALAKAKMSGTEDHDLNLAGSYVYEEWPRLSDRTGGCIDAYVMNLCEKFMQGQVKTLIAGGETNVTPKAVVDDGKLLVVDMPVLKFREPGQFIQMVWKLQTQRECLRRVVTPQSRDVVIWADEAQLHALASVDSMVQAVARSHRLINVAISQNIPLLTSVLKSREDVLAWLSNLQTKFIFANGDKDTNEYFSGLLGQSKQHLASISVTNRPFDWLGDSMGLPQEGGSCSCTEHLLPDVRPEDFTRLRKGGRENGAVVDFFLFQGGRRFNNGKTWLKASMRQMA